MKQSLNKYWFIFWIHLKEELQYPAKILLGSLFLLARVLVVFLVYNYTFSEKSDQLSGSSLNQVLLSIAVYFCLIMTGYRSLYKSMDKDIYSGSIQTWLNKPIDYVLNKTFAGFGSFFANFIVVILLFSLALAIFFNSTVATFWAYISNPFWLGSFILSFILGLIILSIIYICIGLSSFWLEDSQPVFWIIDKLYMVLGGAYLPIALFPDWLKQFTIFSPFGSGMLATNAFNSDFLANFGLYLAAQIFWLVLGILGLLKMYQAGLKKLNLNGG